MEAEASPAPLSTLRKDLSAHSCKLAVFVYSARIEALLILKQQQQYLNTLSWEKFFFPVTKF